MSGGLMQLIAYGAQDIYLTGSPSITFWRIVYRRHTAFASESIEQTFNGTVGWNKRVSCTLSRNGDLVTTVWLEIVLKRKVANDVSGTPFYPAENLIKEAEFELGGQKIDKVYSDWFRIYDELFRKDAEKESYRRMTNFDSNAPDGQVRRFYLPLNFFFNRHPGLALPLIALQYHEAKIHLTLASAEEMNKVGIDTTVDPQVTLFATYIYLDADERRRFAQSSSEILITQLQHTGAESVAPDTTNRKTFNIRLNLNHPTKFLAWAVKQGDVHGKFTTSSDRQEYNDAYAPLLDARLTLNGHDRFSTRRGSWFNQVSTYETLKSKPAAGIYMYPFALRPDEHQPSGTCNFSRIDNATLILTFKAGSAGTNIANVVSEEATLSAVTGLTNLLVYAENYNVLRIMSGMGGLAYSN